MVGITCQVRILEFIPNAAKEWQTQGDNSGLLAPSSLSPPFFSSLLPLDVAVFRKYVVLLGNEVIWAQVHEAVMCLGQITFLVFGFSNPE